MAHHAVMALVANYVATTRLIPLHIRQYVDTGIHSGHEFASGTFSSERLMGYIKMVLRGGYAPPSSVYQTEILTIKLPEQLKLAFPGGIEPRTFLPTFRGRV